MKLFAKYSVITASFQIGISIVVSNLYRPIWEYVYALNNLVVLILLSIFYRFLIYQQEILLLNISYRY